MCEAIHVIAGTHRALDNELLTRRLRGEVAVTVRGAESTTWESFCREVSAVCQFPYYFNHSTGSVQECLRDCSDSYPKVDITIGVRDAHLVLAEEDEDFSTVVSLFWEYLNGSQEGAHRSLLLQGFTVVAGAALGTSSRNRETNGPICHCGVSDGKET